MREFLAAFALCLFAAVVSVAVLPYRQPAIIPFQPEPQITAYPIVDEALPDDLLAAIAVPSIPAAPSLEQLQELNRERARGGFWGSIGERRAANARAIESDLSLLHKARKYLGTNPTGWAHLWCAKFMAMIAPDLAKKVDNPNLARDWAELPKVKPALGVIAVLSRGRGGHIGVVSGFDKRGNPRVISGNHNRVVGEGLYSKHRVIAYVSPTGRASVAAAPPMGTLTEKTFASRFDDAEVACPPGHLIKGKFEIAHPTLPCGTKVRVTNLRNGRSVVATVADKGPCTTEWCKTHRPDIARHRHIDLDHETDHYLRASGMAPVSYAVAQ